MLIHKKSKRKHTIGAVILICLIGAAIFAYFKLKDNHPVTKMNDGRTATSDPNVPNNAPVSDRDNQSVGITAEKEPHGSQPPMSTVTPDTPIGTFVSNHRPNLSGQPSPNRITSTCTTTPGISCKINFTKNGVTKSLPTQITDASGNTTWDWQLQDIGLTEGVWVITAIATNESLSSHSNDSINLTVQL